MALHYLIIDKESEEQTLESVQLLPDSIKRQLALYDIPETDLAEIFGQANGTVEIPNKDNEKMVRQQAKEVVQAFTSPDNFIVTYDDLMYEVKANGVINSDIEINKELTVHVHASDEGYSFEMYSTAELLAENTDEDDLVEPIAETYVLYSELQGEEE